MRVFDEFKIELENIDSRLMVIKNPNHTQLANILIDGINICSIPSTEIREEPDAGYTIEFPNGWVSKHRSRREALEIVKDTIKRLGDSPEFKEIFYSKE